MLLERSTWSREKAEHACVGSGGLVRLLGLVMWCCGDGVIG